MQKLGFTFYPKDWWTSDSFYALNPFERYIYLELLFMMYLNDGFVANDKVNVERRLLTTIKDEVWVKITDLLVKDGDKLTHLSVNSRMKKTLANRENGKKGGRPKGSTKKPKKPKPETHAKTQKNPPLEREREREIEKKENVNARALHFLKTNYPYRFETQFQMRYGNKIRDKKKFTQDFNDKVDIEGLEFTDRILFARLNTFSRNWIENQEKYARPEENKQTSGIPIG